MNHGVRLSGRAQPERGNQRLVGRDPADLLPPRAIFFHSGAGGVVHGDTKPDNILVTRRRALGLDFGVAKAVSEATDGHALITAGMALGAPACMAPEQAAAEGNVDHRADIYALGSHGLRDAWPEHSPRCRSRGHAVP